MSKFTHRTDEHNARVSESPGDARPRRSVFRVLGLGLITGAADDDPSAIGTYAAAGAKLGFSFLWTAPVTFPMMFTVVYLSSKLGQVTGQGLFQVMREHVSRWILYPTLIAVLIGNTIEAGAGIGGMAAAVNVLLPVPHLVMILATTAAILALQIWGSYTLIRNLFRWLALALLAYVGAAFLARPQFLPVLKGTLVPAIAWNRDFLALLVAVLGTTLSAYLFTWQSNEEVEERIAQGRTEIRQRRGASQTELRQSRWDIVLGMFFSNLVMYFIILSTAATLYQSGGREISSAAQAAQALRPLAGSAASILFAAGLVAVGFLAVPVMTAGAAYDLSQTLGWRYSLHARPKQAPGFYTAIVIVAILAMGLNFLGVNPMKALVWAGIVQGFSTPALMLIILLLTSSRAIMGDKVNGRVIRIFGWITTVTIFAASFALIASWLI